MHNLETLREHLFDTLDRLSIDNCDVKKETERAMSVIAVSKCIIETGRLEIDFAKSMNNGDSIAFFTNDTTQQKSIDPIEKLPEPVKELRYTDVKIEDETIVIDMDHVPTIVDEEHEPKSFIKTPATIKPMNEQKMSVINAVVSALRDADKPLLGLELRQAAQKQCGGAIMEYSQFNKMLTEALSKNTIIKKHFNEFDYYVLSTWLDEDAEEFLDPAHAEYLESKQNTEA